MGATRAAGANASTKNQECARGLAPDFCRTSDGPMSEPALARHVRVHPAAAGELRVPADVAIAHPQRSLAPAPVEAATDTAKLTSLNKIGQQMQRRRTGRRKIREPPDAHRRRQRSGCPLLGGPRRCRTRSVASPVSRTDEDAHQTSLLLPEVQDAIAQARPILSGAGGMVVVTGGHWGQ